MTEAIASLVVNMLIVVLLAVTIGYCWVLNRRIRILQDSRSELAQLLKHFDESTQRASESIIALQTASKKIGENIQLRIDKANYLIDDLAFMMEKGSKLANQLEASFAVNRARSRISVEKTEPEEQEEEVKLQGPVLPQPAANAKEKTRSSLEAVLERLAVRNKPLVTPEAEDETPRTASAAKPSARSRSEQELLDMLRAGMKG